MSGDVHYNDVAVLLKFENDAVGSYDVTDDGPNGAIYTQVHQYSPHQVSNAKALYGTKSLYTTHGSTNPYIPVPFSVLDMSNGKLTLEFALHRGAPSSSNTLDMRWDDGGNTNGLLVQISGGTPSEFYVLTYDGAGGYYRAQKFNIGTQGTWEEYAACFDNGTVYMFRNGVLVNTDSSIVNFSFPSTGDFKVHIDSWDAYLDNLRITNKVCRYTSNYTTADFETTLATPPVEGTLGLVTETETVGGVFFGAKLGLVSDTESVFAVDAKLSLKLAEETETVFPMTVAGTPLFGIFITRRRSGQNV